MNDETDDEREEPLTVAGCLASIIALCLVLASIAGLAFLRAYFLR